MSATEEWRAGFRAALATTGTVTDPAWLAAFRDTPRDVFVPYFFTQTPGRPGWRLVEPGSADYLSGLTSTRPLITQLDSDDSKVDAARTGPVEGVPTSSSSEPTLMAVMLEALDLHDGHQVLEIGTGTGYNTALLCHRLGADHVSTVEVDPGLVDHARDRLAALGYAPHIEATDGTSGCPARAPFDRLIATVAVRRLPAAWITQTRPGGLVLVPLDRRNTGGLLARLTVHPDGTAQGRFLPDYGGFMPIRSEQEPDAAQRVFRDVDPYDTEPSTTTLPSDTITEEHGPFVFFAALTVPGGGWDQMEFIPADGGPAETWLAQGDGSWVCHTTTDRRHDVRQGGPARLWDAIEQAHTEWQHIGQPVRERFGLTVDHGTPTVWLDEPDGPHRWHLTG